MIITFDDEEQLEYISSFVSIVSDVHEWTDTKRQ